MVLALSPSQYRFDTYAMQGITVMQRDQYSLKKYTSYLSFFIKFPSAIKSYRSFLTFKESAQNSSLSFLDKSWKKYTVYKGYFISYGDLPNCSNLENINKWLWAAVIFFTHQVKIS